MMMRGKVVAGLAVLAGLAVGPARQVAVSVSVVEVAETAAAADSGLPADLGQLTGRCCCCCGHVLCLGQRHSGHVVSVHAQHLTVDLRHLALVTETAGRAERAASLHLVQPSLRLSLRFRLKDPA